MFEVPIISSNKAIRMYEVDRKIEDMIERGEDSELITKEISKLRKYSYNDYVSNNLKFIGTDPKSYHKCL